MSCKYLKIWKRKLLEFCVRLFRIPDEKHKYTLYMWKGLIYILYKYQKKKMYFPLFFRVERSIHRIIYAEPRETPRLQTDYMFSRKMCLKRNNVQRIFILYSRVSEKSRISVSVFKLARVSCVFEFIYTLCVYYRINKHYVNVWNEQHIYIIKLTFLFTFSELRHIYSVGCRCLDILNTINWFST